MQRSPQSTAQSFRSPASAARAQAPGNRRQGSNRNLEIPEGKIHCRQPGVSTAPLGLLLDLPDEERTTLRRAGRGRRGSGKPGPPPRSETPDLKRPRTKPSPQREMKPNTP